MYTIVKQVFSLNHLDSGIRQDKLMLHCSYKKSVLVLFIFATDDIVKLSIFNIHKTLFYAENTGCYFWTLKGSFRDIHTKE